MVCQYFLMLVSELLSFTASQGRRFVIAARGWNVPLAPMTPSSCLIAELGPKDREFSRRFPLCRTGKAGAQALGRGRSCCQKCSFGLVARVQVRSVGGDNCGNR